MPLSYKIKIAQALTKRLHWNYDLPLEDIESRIKINPFFTGKFSYLVLQEPQFNNATSDELLALQKEVNNEVFYRSINKKLCLDIYVDSKQFIKDIFDLNFKKLFYYQKPLKFVVDFSSPNIAKPFHFGHFRSTIIGNFISNIHKFMGHSVVKINYLGDWGVQFGLLKVGLEDSDFNEEMLSENPLKVLHKAYVSAVKNAEDNPEIYERAKQIFNELEHADEDSPSLKDWYTFRNYTLKELSKTYERLGIVFDEYNWESDYSAKRIQPLIDEMKRKNILSAESDKSLVARILGETIPFIKHDGTTLYLTRDVAAAIDRYQRHKFDKMYYVVDTGQRGHFVAVTAILKQLNQECADKVKHVPFGRIKGMSTRKGEVVWLDDILNTIKDKMEQLQLQTITTKVPVGGEISDILGISAVLVYDLKMNRSRHYDFEWDTALKTEGFTGIQLQYTHCRLVNLEENCGVTVAKECDPTVLQENEALGIIHQISRFEDAIIDSYNKLDACILILYLFELCTSINRGFQKLRIKGNESHLASQRLLLFVKARSVLNLGMRIIGLKPLSKM